jgi:outer membrane receptor protein involved in Fe transport
VRLSNNVAVAVVSGVGLSFASIAAGGTAQAASAQRFEAPAGSIGRVASTLAVQGRVTITVTDPSVAALRSPGVRGSFTIKEAVTRALRGTNATAIFYDARTIAIVRRTSSDRPKPRKTLPEKPLPTVEPDHDDIVVMASKQRSTLDRFPGSVKLIELDRGWVARHAADGSAALTDMLPIVGSTNLGPARNKLFIRGIADSSFNGPSQATVGQYLGDVRLNYNAPDPNLNLYDLERIEVLVGPQGTLYGASSLGGVIRLVPNAPDADAVAGSVSVGGSATQDGGLGGDFAAMVNVPVIPGTLAVRLVGFVTQGGGYIDSPARGRRDINSTFSVGQRLVVRFTPNSGWNFDAGLVIQNSKNRDGQYTLRADSPLTRDNGFAQPFHNDYYLTHFTAAGPIGDLELLTTTSVASHRLSSIFDATGADGTATRTRLREDNYILLTTHETRVTGGTSAAPWVAGFSSVYSLSALLRTFGPTDVRPVTNGVLNERLEAAVFGQVSRPLFPTITGTVGGRFTLAHSSGLPVDETGLGTDRVSRNAQRFSTTLALSWQPTSSFTGFFHFQQGYRAGGLTLSPTGSTQTAQRFASDDLNMNEIGFRLGKEGHDRFSLRSAVFAADWNNIQADLVDSAGLPYTANIGRGRIYGLDTDLTWRPHPALTITAAAFINASDVTKPAPGFGGPGTNPFPNIASNGERVSVAWHKTVDNDIEASATGSVRYVGKSRLGIAPLLDLSQGGYAVGSLGGRLDIGRYGIALDVDNVANVSANSFAFGNPFGVADGNQITPVRPRTIRLGIDAQF